jgi:hypothetical protein
MDSSQSNRGDWHHERVISELRMYPHKEASALCCGLKVQIMTEFAMESYELLEAG